MASYSMKDVHHLMWFMELKLDQIMKQKSIFQQRNSVKIQKAFSGPEWDLRELSQKGNENCSMTD